MSIKQSPRDFQVSEQLEFEPDPMGEYYVYLLRKEKVDTQEALGMICKRTNVPRQDIAFAGLKDRQGRTEQYISIHGRRVEFKAPGVELLFKGRAAIPIHSKQSRGNRFRIMLRQLNKPTAEWIRDALPRFARQGYVNYFDNQRFGCLRHGQGFPMRDVLAGRYEKALQRLIARPSPVALGGDTKLKRLLQEHWGNWDVCAKIVRGPVYRPVIEHLRRHRDDFAGAICKLNTRTLLIQSFAYQSYLWNRGVSSILADLVPHEAHCRIDSLMGDLHSYHKLTDELSEELAALSAPLYAPDGAGGDPRFRAEMERWLKSEQLTPEMCKQNSLPGMIWREEPRDLLVYPTNAYANAPERDETERGALKLEIAFSLPRGVYATMLVKHLFAGVAANLRNPRPRGASPRRSQKHDHD